MIVEIDSIHGSEHRMVFYRVTDDTGAVHQYGPVISSDPSFDAEAHKSVVAEKVAEMLAAAEFDALVGGA